MSEILELLKILYGYIERKDCGMSLFSKHFNTNGVSILVILTRGSAINFSKMWLFPPHGFSTIHNNFIIVNISLL